MPASSSEARASVSLALLLISALDGTPPRRSADWKLTRTRLGGAISAADPEE